MVSKTMILTLNNLIFEQTYHKMWMFFQVCCVFPYRRNMAISIINGAIDTSSVILLLFKVLNNYVLLIVL